ncbi:methyltransferase domain-containing protein [Amycolatopsis sp. NBC_01488]|uniref:class I SAM-dependent methyltransferase n=1 Tax=Amycolatopsis sp. NBC_01488 TaxID=2903563 RepID=UPI002E2A6A6F|nr:methyltransferase domain-containing protein [Amycolatopsis sp. NBC_01488]
MNRDIRSVAGGRALELGCGPGRNTRRLAEVGYEVDAVDRSSTAIAAPASTSRTSSPWTCRRKPDTGLFGMPLLLAGLFRKD